MKPYRVGIDIGGTFTDLTLIDDRDGTTTIVKMLTTPDDPARAVQAALRAALDRAGITAASVANVVHGTTLVTNALIERKGTRTASISTAGFRDTLEIARECRYDMYDLGMELPKPLVP
ncbi:MAG TPA: hydantoinase/oxoprolinase N-terminal domain-containing protein, partial [Dehalococcoidia bacterium]|nr:hydantoinase/oxoprolinase N-terminal domain-containing protein [Dehalococcoidia bacterium]